jgi:hypothetical protein
MAFPADPVAVTATIAFDGSTPVDVSAAVRVDQGMTRTFWRTESGDTSDPSRCTLVLQAPIDNPGLYNPDDPSGTYWQPDGWLGAQVEVQVEGEPWFSGQVTKASPSWELGADGYLGYCTIQADGPLNLVSGEPTTPLLRAGILADGPLIYWPMEDGTSSTQLEEATGTGRPATWTGSITLASQAPPGGNPVPALADDTEIVFPIGASPDTGAWSIECLVQVPSAPTTFADILAWNTSSQANRWYLSIHNDTSDYLQLEAYSKDGTRLVSVGVTIDEATFYGQWFTVTAAARYDGSSSYSWDVNILNVSGGYSFASVSGIAGQSGYITRIETRTAYPPPAGWLYGHMSIWDTDLGASPTHYLLTNSYEGDLAHQRFGRIAGLIGVSYTSDVHSSTVMGPQLQESPLDQMLAVQTADQGRLIDTADGRVAYQSQQERYLTTTAAMTLTGDHLAELATDHDTDTVLGDVTVTRRNGTSAHLRDDAVMAAGGRSITFDDVQLEYDASVLPLAQFLAAAASRRGPVITVIPIDLATDDGSLVAAWQAIIASTGPALVEVDPIAGVLPDGGRYFIDGGSETVTDVSWSLSLVVVSAAPYRRMLRASTSTCRREATRSTVGTAASSSATTLVVATSGSGATWSTDSASYPVTVLVAGERCVFTEPPSGSSSPQTFANVTRSVNSVTKAQAVGGPVTLWRPGVRGRRT